MRIKLVHKITLCAMLIVLNVLFTSIPRYFEIGPLFSFNRITLGPAITIFSSIILGPVFGALTGGASDALAWIIFPNSGSSLNIFITILYTLMGILPFYIYKLFNKKQIVKKWIIPAILIFFWCLFWILLWFTTLFDSTFVGWGWNLVLSKIIVTSITLISLLILLFVLLQYSKKNDDSFKVITIVCVFTEIFFMVLLKPLCFLLQATIVGESTLLDFYGINYSFLIIMALMFATVNITINSIFVNFIYKLSRKFVGD